MKTNLMIAAAAGAVWVIAFFAHERLMDYVAYAPGIDLLFLPSGVRLLALMIGGFSAAVGVCLGSLFLTGIEFSTRDMPQIVLISLFSGFAPYASLRLALRLVRVEASLKNLAPQHLPILSLGVAVGSSTLHNALFWGLGLEQSNTFTHSVIAMATGDFLGSLAAVVVAMGLLRLAGVRRL